MSEEVGHGSFLWDNHSSWPFSSSDNSGGGSPDDQKSGKNITKPLDSSSCSPTPTPTPTAVAAKRGRDHGGPKSGGKLGGSVDHHCKGGGGESDHEIHIWTERERRKKMRNMFSNLHALLPQLPAKADKSTIVDEAVNYIKTLQHSLQKLQKQKLEMVRGPAATTTIEYEPSVLLVGQTPPTINSSSSSREAFLADRVSSRNLAATTNSMINTTNCLLQTWSSPNVVLSVSGDDAQINVCAPKKAGFLAAVFYVLEKHKLDVVTAHISSDYYRSMYMIHAHANRSCDQFQEALSVEEMFKLAVGEIIFWISS